MEDILLQSYIDEQFQAICNGQTKKYWIYRLSSFNNPLLTPNTINLDNQHNMLAYFVNKINTPLENGDENYVLEPFVNGFYISEESEINTGQSSDIDKSISMITKGNFYVEGDLNFKNGEIYMVSINEISGDLTDLSKIYLAIPRKTDSNRFKYILANQPITDFMSGKNSKILIRKRELIDGNTLSSFEFKPTQNFNANVKPYVVSEGLLLGFDNQENSLKISSPYIPLLVNAYNVDNHSSLLYSRVMDKTKTPDIANFLTKYNSSGNDLTFLKWSKTSFSLLELTKNKYLAYCLKGVLEMSIMKQVINYVGVSDVNSAGYRIKQRDGGLTLQQFALNTIKPFIKMCVSQSKNSKYFSGYDNSDNIYLFSPAVGTSFEEITTEQLNNFYALLRTMGLWLSSTSSYEYGFSELTKIYCDFYFDLDGITGNIFLQVNISGGNATHMNDLGNIDTAYFVVKGLKNKIGANASTPTEQQLSNSYFDDDNIGWKNKIGRLINITKTGSKYWIENTFFAEVLILTNTFLGVNGTNAQNGIAISNYRFPNELSLIENQFKDIFNSITDINLLINNQYLSVGVFNIITGVQILTYGSNNTNRYTRSWAIPFRDIIVRTYNSLSTTEKASIKFVYNINTKSLHSTYYQQRVIYIQSTSYSLKWLPDANKDLGNNWIEVVGYGNAYGVNGLTLQLEGYSFNPSSLPSQINTQSIELEEANYTQEGNALKDYWIIGNENIVNKMIALRYSDGSGIFTLPLLKKDNTLPSVLGSSPITNPINTYVEFETTGTTTLDKSFTIYHLGYQKVSFYNGNDIFDIELGNKNDETISKTTINFE